MKDPGRFVASMIITLLYITFGVIGLIGIPGVIEKQTWAKNVFLFVLWVQVVLWTLAAFIPDAGDETRAKGRSIPAWISAILDVVVILGLASLGMFCSATAQLWSVLCEAIVFQDPKKDKSVKENKDEKIEQP